MSKPSIDLDSSLTVRLDQLVARFLRAEEEGQSIDLQSVFQRDSALQAPFDAFLKQHLEMKRSAGSAITSPLLGKQPPGFLEPPPLRSAEPGHILGHCCILRELGRGGMGIVYQGRHVRLDALRAIKILPREKVSDESVVRFWREAQTAAKIEHPNVVTIHDVGHEDDLHYIIMQFIDGETLLQVLRRHISKTKGQLFPWEMALRIAHPVLDALAVMHSRGLFHRDIKPSNIMVANTTSVTRNRRVVLMDFGLVRNEFETRLTETGAVMGTPAYMAPEQARGVVVDGRADIYGVGACLYYLLAGRPPFDGHSAEVYFKAASGELPQPLSELRPELPAPVLELVARAMAPDLGQRFQSAEEALKEIGRVLRHAPKEPSKPVSMKPGHSPAIILQNDDSSAAAHHDTDTKCGDTNASPPIFIPLEVSPRARKTEGLDSVSTLPVRPSTSSPSWNSFSAAEKSSSPLAKLKQFGPLAGIVAILLMVVGGFYFLQDDPSKQSSMPAATPAVAATNRTQGMVLVPAGESHVGNSEQRLRQHGEEIPSTKGSPDLIDQFVTVCLKEPEQIIHVQGFWIDKYEVTNAQYAQFVKVTRRTTPAHWTGRNPPQGKEDHPVTGVRYDDAVAYATWAGKKLPTLAQWTRAYRGSDDRFYPWGDQWVPERANTSQNPAFEIGTSPEWHCRDWLRAQEVS